MHLRFSRCVAAQQKPGHMAKMLLKVTLRAQIFCRDQETGGRQRFPIKHWA